MRVALNDLEVACGSNNSVNVGGGDHSESKLLIS